MLELVIMIVGLPSDKMCSMSFNVDQSQHSWNNKSPYRKETYTPSLSTFYVYFCSLLFAITTAKRWFVDSLYSFGETKYHTQLLKRRVFSTKSSISHRLPVMNMFFNYYTKNNDTVRCMPSRVKWVYRDKSRLCYSQTAKRWFLARFSTGRAAVRLDLSGALRSKRLFVRRSRTYRRDRKKKNVFSVYPRLHKNLELLLQSVSSDN